MPNKLNQVLEKLPKSIHAGSDFSQLRQQLLTNPNNLQVATKLAQLYIEESRAEGDPRYLGYAQAALNPWWKLSNPPVEVLILRATVLQSTHQFDAALKDLDAALDIAPSNGQAWITRATILQVQGQYSQALKSCQQLTNLAPAIITLTCMTNVTHLNGQAEKSYRELKTAYAQNTDKNNSIDSWILTLLAEMANRLGDNIAAEQHFLAAINLGQADTYLLGAYADFLLDKKRFIEVVSLLKDKTTIDPLLLRYAEALQMTNSAEAEKMRQRLKLSFAAASLRNDTVHQREQSRFELRLMQNPSRALMLAKNNWSTQKEPADARVYLEAAIAMQDQASIKIIGDWLTAHKQQDVILQALIKNGRVI